MRVSSGWRSAAYQQRLFDEAVRTYGSADVAAEFVATAAGSSHVTGEAVDIVPVDAQYWLIAHGWQWGLCQTYANEAWHFELATEPGGACPEMWTDAAARG
jgi:zinc D-Ala-D-Ala carboxypeptidase